MIREVNSPDQNAPILLRCVLCNLLVDLVLETTETRKICEEVQICKHCLFVLHSPKEIEGIRGKGNE